MISNIKKQLINYYGYNKMSNLYGSSLQEILDFLEKNNEKITFIFDGLDHIDREFLIHSSELSKEITEVKNMIWYAKDNIEFEYDSICQYYAKKFSYEKIHSILYTTDEEPILKK